MGSRREAIHTRAIEVDRGRQPRRVQQTCARSPAGTSPPPDQMLRAWLEPIQGFPLRFAASLVSHLALAGIGSLAISTFASLPTLAAPGITLKGSFVGYNGSNPYAALTPAGNGKFYGTTSEGGYNGVGAIFEFDPGADSVPTPAPLPLMGAGAAFGWSRKLRRRLRLQQPGARSLA